MVSLYGIEVIRGIQTSHILGQDNTNSASGLDRKPNLTFSNMNNFFLYT